MKKDLANSNQSKKLEIINLSNSNLDLAAVVLSTAVLIAVVFLPYHNSSVFRQILGVALLIFNPGYALSAALFPKKNDLKAIERIALAVGLSIALVPLLALPLTYSGPITLGSIVGVLALFIVFCSFIGLQRRRSLVVEDRFTFRWDGLRGAAQLLRKKRSERDRMMGIILIVSIVLSMLVVVYAVITPNQVDRYTEFYILNSQGKAKDYPTQLSLQSGTQVKVGIVNREGYKVTYELVIGQNESSQLKQLYAEGVTVDENQQWEKTILLKPDAPGNDMEFKFLLYKGGFTTSPYREAHLFANVTV
jgi:uncharacterized membrane protein